jgi:glycosyltransferase involved in cell wall biosynthesis
VKSIIYLSLNNGEDTRITKEIKTLHRAGRITFIGQGNELSTNILAFVERTYLFKGRSRFLAICYQWVVLASLLLKFKKSSLHIVNEQNLIVIWPLAFFFDSVVDVFDSIFLQWNKPENQWAIVKRLLYLPVRCVIVTDEARKKLLPDFLQARSIVVGNYPFYQAFGPKPLDLNNELVILFYGWLGQHRGGYHIKGLLDADPSIHVLMAGWFSDDFCKSLVDHPRVRYLGVLTQDEALQYAHREAHYIMCVYAPHHTNNIFASPNKVYDGIMTKTPIIMNPEVVISQFVQNSQTGFILVAYDVYDFFQLAQELKKRYTAFLIPDDLAKRYSWESQEPHLIGAHAG